MRTDCCRHYFGLGLGGNRVCQAGVNVRELVGGPDFGWGLRQPCKLGNPAEVTCDRREFPTEAEVDAWKSQMNRAMEAGDRLVDRIIAADPARGESVTVGCEICGGVVNAVVLQNGHVHAVCQTDGCLMVSQ